MKKPLSKRILERLEINKRKKALLENMTPKDALSVFGLTSVPDKSKLKSLYRKLAVKNHPDHGGSAEKMAEINAAYEILMNDSTDYSDFNDNHDSKPHDFMKDFNDIIKDTFISPMRMKAFKVAKIIDTNTNCFVDCGKIRSIFRKSKLFISFFSLTDFLRVEVPMSCCACRESIAETEKWIC